MIRYPHTLFALAALTSFTALAAEPSPSPDVPAKVARLRDAALQDGIAWDLVKALTTEIGPRLAGSEAEARARAWGVEKLKALGFANVHIESFPVEGWERGIERAEILGPHRQSLALTALGRSGATPTAGIEGEVIFFASLAALEAAPRAAVAGKIVFVTHRMGPTQDGSSYGALNAIRTRGPSIAAAKGAGAYLLRSLATGTARLPHTGMINWPAGQQPIPAAALAVPDAEQLERLFAENQPVRLRLTLTPRSTGTQQSGNVIAEIPGRDPQAGVIVLGGHLDSWDLGTGALDDATGIAITTAAARAATREGPLRRTIRIIWFGAEEIGGLGGIAYDRAHGGEAHALAAESDFGADRIWRFQTSLTPDHPVIATLGEALAPLGILYDKSFRAGGTDVQPIGARGVPLAMLGQDGRRYFDFHHSADDTLDKVDRAQMQQNVAAWTTLLLIAGEAENWPKNSDSAPDKVARQGRYNTQLLHFFVDGLEPHVMETLGTASGRAQYNILGAARMKKLSFVLAAAGLMSLAACNKPATPVENAADNAAGAMENVADNLEAAADNAINESAEQVLENAADNAHAAADNMADAADNAH